MKKTTNRKKMYGSRGYLAKNRRTLEYKAEPKKSDEEIKTESDARRAARKRRNIRIHADRIEDLDERDRREKAEAIEAKETGWKCRCRLVNRPSRWNWLRRVVNRCAQWAMPEGENLLPMRYDRRVELPRKLLCNRVVTRCVHLFHDPKRDKMYMQFPPLKMMNRTSIAHVEQYRLPWLRRFGFFAILDMTPEPGYVMLLTGVNPQHHTSMEYELVEEVGKDRYMGVGHVYRMEPIFD